MAGIPLLAAVPRRRSLAVELAADSGMTFIGFLRGEQMNVYAGYERIARRMSDDPTHKVGGVRRSPSATAGEESTRRSQWRRDRRAFRAASADVSRGERRG